MAEADGIGSDLDRWLEPFLGIHTAKAAVAEDRGRAALTASGRG
jgi:hypothetical protein